MSEKTYICRNYPGYKISKGRISIQFANCLFRTDDPEKQAIIEKADGFGSMIVLGGEASQPIAPPAPPVTHGPMTAKSFEGVEHQPVEQEPIAVKPLNAMTDAELDAQIAKVVKQKREENDALAGLHEKQRKKAKGEDAVTMIDPLDPNRPTAKGRAE
jgi:hypothetical protein